MRVAIDKNPFAGRLTSIGWRLCLHHQAGRLDAAGFSTALAGDWAGLGRGMHGPELARAQNVCRFSELSNRQRSIEIALCVCQCVLDAGRIWAPAPAAPKTATDHRHASDRPLAAWPRGPGHVAA